MCYNIGTVSCFVINLSVPADVCTVGALKKCNGVLPSCFVPLGFFQLFNGLVLTDFTVRRGLKNLFTQGIHRFVKVTSFLHNEFGNLFCV